MLTLENVFYRYKNSGTDVLKAINATFAQGKTHAIVGSSGSGKTTLLSIIAGLDSPSSGAVSINDEDLSKMDLDQYRRERVSIIFQAFQLFPMLTALENVSAPMHLNGINPTETTRKAIQLLQSVGIDEPKQKRYPSNLSGGEQQRVAIARALSSGAKIILADEPTGNLDKSNSDSIMQILKNLASENNYCVIIVTHDIEIANAADVTFRMSDGELK
ncbi:MAG: ABC transporter ATP-binding protein [Defluviitaleaceae bacterium]|nr:ABC transporter ATP-binding protein [Defluviitaleaceae bacterium]